MTATTALAPTIARPTRWPVLEPDADEVLLELLARDTADPAPHYTFTYYPPHPAGEPLAPRPYIPREPPTLEERERRRELRQKLTERLERQREQDRIERLAYEQAARQQRKASWLALIETAANEIRGTKYEQAMLPDLLNDHATIQAWPLDRPFPGHIDAWRFAQQYHERRAAIDKQEQEESEP